MSQHGYNAHCVRCGALSDVTTLSQMMCEECREKLRNRPNDQSTDPAIVIPTSYALATPVEARMMDPNELTVTVSGPVNSGKTVLLTLLASFLHEAMTRHALGPNIRLAYKVTEEFKPIEQAVDALRTLTGDGGIGLSITLETVQASKR